MLSESAAVVPSNSPFVPELLLPVHIKKTICKAETSSKGCLGFS